MSSDLASRSARAAGRGRDCSRCWPGRSPAGVAALALLAAGALALVASGTCTSSTCSPAGPAARSKTRCPRGAAPGRSPLPRSIGGCGLRSARQRDLRLALERFVSAAEAMPEGMVVLDAANRIQWANPRARAHLGLELRHDAGAPLINLVRQPAFVQYLAGGDFSEPVIVESQREAGVTLSIQVVPFGVEEKLLISRDITRLEAVARMRRDFIANVSHELKTPLTVSDRFPGDAADLDLDERQRERYIALMRGAGAEHAAPGRRSPDAVGAGKRAERAARSRVRHRAAAAAAVGRRQGALRAAGTRSRSTSAIRPT